MARTGFFHHLGTFFLLAATILLIITCISAPVVHDIAILKVHLNGKGTARGSDDPSISFGTFGYCITHNDGPDACTSSRLGYSPSAALSATESGQGDLTGDFLDNDTDTDHNTAVTVRKLTKAMVLHPIACGLNFIAFMLALGAGMVGSFLASVVALLAFLTTAVIMIIDFVMFSMVRTHVDDWTGSDNHESHYGVAAWTILAGAICSLLGTIVLFFTCCSGRMHKKRNGMGAKNDYGETVPVAPVRATRRRKRFGLF